MVSRRASDPQPHPRGVAGPSAQPSPRRFHLRPMARVERINLFEREVRERLSRSALDLALETAAVISEGQRATRAGRECFFGSTMLTIDLAKVAPAVRDACDARAAQRLGALLAEDAGARTRVQAIVESETTRLLGSKPRSLITEIRVRARGIVIYVDVDLEATP